MRLADRELLGWTGDLHRFLLIPGLTYLLLFAAFTWPAMASFGSHFFCDDGDGLQNVWNIWWVKQALVESGTHPWHSELLHHPGGTSLIGQTMNPINGLLGIPLSLLLGQIQVFNALVIFAFVSSGLAAFWLAWFLLRDYWVSIFVGAAFTFSSYHFAHAEGHLQLVTMQGLPLFLLAWLQLLRRPSAIRATLAAAAFWLVLLSDYYYSMYCGIAALMLLLGSEHLQRRPLRFSAELGRPFLLFCTLASLLALPLLLALARAGLNDDLIGSHDPREASMDLLAPFIPGGHWWLNDWTQGFWSQLPGNIHESDVYLRWTLLLPAAFALWKFGAKRGSPCRPWAIMGMVFLAISLGPRLQIWGQQLPYLPTPYGILEIILPPLEHGGTPVRFAVMALLCISILAGMGLRPFLGKIFAGRAWPFLLIFAIETWPRPIPLTRIEVPESVEGLADLPEGAVIDLSGSMCERLLRQTWHERPVIDGYISRYPHAVLRELVERKELYRSGRYRELMDRTEARYLVLPSELLPKRELTGLRVLIEGEQMSILCRTDDPLLAQAHPR